MAPKIILVLLVALAWSAEIRYSVTEGFGVARTAGPVSGGIAFCKGQLQSAGNLALFNGAQEIPAQFSPLTRHTDNSLQWVLVDFLDDYAVNGKKDYVLRTQAPVAQPVHPVIVSRAGSIVTLDNGVIKLSVDTVNFRGIHSLEYGGTPLVSGDGGLELLEVMHGALCVNGPVTRASFVYLGPVRASLRIEGEFFRDSAGGVGYSYLLTVYAGSPRVTISAAIRNSINPAVGRAARIARARALFGLAYDPASVVEYDTVLVRAYTQPATDTLRTARAFLHPSGKGLAVTEKWGGGNYPPNINRALLSGRSLGVDIVREYHAQAAYPLFYADSIYVMRDLTHKTSEITLECFEGNMTQAGLRTLNRGMKGRLRPFQDPQSLADANALSAGRFGTEADEAAAYAKWGWTIPADVRSQEVPAAQTDVCPRFTLDIHGDTETDPVRNFLLQWVRTGKQGLFDVAECWARFYRDLVAWRTVGFVQDGQYQVGSFVQQKARRLPIAGPAAGDAVWTYNVADYNTYGGCHTAMEGMADFYCLTGDPDALEALEDYGEMELARTMARPPDTTAASTTSFSDRATGRKFAFLVRLYEITRAQVWRDLIKLKATAMFRSTARHPLVYAKDRLNAGLEPQHNELITRTLPLPDSLAAYLRVNRIGFEMDAVGAVSGRDSATNATWPVYVTARWEGAYIAQAFSRYFDLTGDEDARDMLIGYAQYIKWTQTARCRLAGSYASFCDAPAPGKSMMIGWAADWDPAHAVCYSSYSTAAGGVMGGHSMVKTVLYPSIYALAYSHTGYSYLLDEARAAWNRGSKYTGTRFLRDENTLHAFSFCGSYQGSQYIPKYAYAEYKDDFVFQVCHVFREAAHHLDTVPPEAVTDLSVGRAAGNTGLAFRWTAPEGGATEYQLKYFKDNPIREYPDFEYNYDRFYASGDTNRVAWWYAKNAPGEPAPGPAGSPEGFTLTGSFPESETFYAALCSRDTAGNLSRLSNPVKIDGNISIETGARSGENRFALSAAPNPFNPAVRLTAWVPANFNQRVQIRIFSAQGRLVREFTGHAVKGCFAVCWDGLEAGGRPAASGIYAVRLAAGPRERIRKIALVK